MNEMSRVTASEPLPAELEAKRPSKLRIAILVSVPLIIFAALLFVWLTSGRTVTTDNALVGAPVVSVAPEINGLLVNVRVKENQMVKAGDVLFTVDPAPFRIAELQAEAALGNARIQVAELSATASARGADIQSKAADVTARASDVALAQETFRRQSALLARGFTTRASYDQALAAVNAARAARGAADAERQAAAATAQSARAALGTGEDGQPPAIAAALAQLERARLDLRRTEIRAPISGRVVQTDRLQPGNMATQALPMVSLVGGDDYWVEANFKETQLAKIRVGQRATVRLDAVPGRAFAAQVIGIGAGTGSQFSLLPAQNATGNWVKVTQRVPVRLHFTEPLDRPLVAGWSAKVTVRVRD